ncbi:MAG TPA: GNAT family N-acetyltransferase [Caulobacteraceae bacterium]|nr:GNAT family N-acetyltransferase [Caulobacteraceae bacterium]
MDELINLRTPRLELRPFAISDAERVLTIQSNWNVTRMLRMAPWPPSLELTREWLASHAAERRAGAGHRFAVRFRGDLIGCADVDEIEAGGGVLGYWFDEAAWGQGFATEAARAVLDFARGPLGLVRITSGRAGDNEASGRVLEKLGFERTGEGRVWSRPRGVEIEQVWYAFAPRPPAA